MMDMVDILLIGGGDISDEDLLELIEYCKEDNHEKEKDSESGAA